MFFLVNFLSHCIPCWLDDFIIKIYNAAYQTIFSRFGEFLIFWMTTIVLKTVRSNSVVTRHHCLPIGCPLTPFSWGFFSHPDVIRPVYFLHCTFRQCNYNDLYEYWFDLMCLIIASTIYQLMNLVMLFASLILRVHLKIENNCAYSTEFSQLNLYNLLSTVLVI